MKTLIIDILIRLASIPALKYISIDWGQLDFYFDKPPVKFPCALIEIRQAQYANEGQHTQRGTVTIEIRIADLLLSNASSKAPTGQKDKAFAIFDLVSEVYKALHGWHKEGSTYGALTRTALQKINRDDGIKEYRLTFVVELADHAARTVTLANVDKVTIEKL